VSSSFRQPEPAEHDGNYDANGNLINLTIANSHTTQNAFDSPKPVEDADAAFRHADANQELETPHLQVSYKLPQQPQFARA
jgi:hypothetical protein